MKRKQYLIIMAIAAVSGILGGMISLHFIAGEYALAQTRDVLKAQGFMLVHFDNNNRWSERAALYLGGLNSEATGLSIRDNRGMCRIRIAVHGVNEDPYIEFYSKDGNVTARLPGGSMYTGSVSPVRRLSLGTGGKADQASVSFGDLESITYQLNIIMDKLDELARYH